MIFVIYLSLLWQKIGRLSSHNIIVPEPLYNYKISGYVQKMPFEEALQTLASVNGLCVENQSSTTWFVFREEDTHQQENIHSYLRRCRFTPDELKVDSLGLITAHIAQGNVQDIIWICVMHSSLIIILYRQ